VSAVIGAVALFFLTVAMSSLTVSSAQATPAIAKGKPCGTCHAGSPPSKSNLKKKKK
jgi:cytochrome c551/c552